MVKVLERVNERYGEVEGYVRATGLDADQIESIRTALVD
tara:strand:- start:189 stop:305 length:117 start_codon:yes stop_codon:yes gene_type:complete